MDKAYSHKDWEDQIYQKWEESGAFRPEVNENGEPFTIIMPPPNANDPLHVGHAMFVAVEDILTRYHRMKGDKTLWLPGTDHAGIETQYVFEKKLAKEGKSRFDYDRETLYAKIWEYVHTNSDVAVNQLKKLGASADWSRYKFTLDKEIIDEVVKTFKKLYEDGLVYRGERLVNYCTKCGTGYSELEVEYEERTDPLYYVKYQLVEDGEAFSTSLEQETTAQSSIEKQDLENNTGDSSPAVGVTNSDDGNDETNTGDSVAVLQNDKVNGRKYVVVATTRPEPIAVDTHLAVNPNDQKNNWLIGRKVLNPITDNEMEILADEMVDIGFGTGIVKLTPAHDAADWEVAEKFGLPKIQAIGVDGRMLETAGSNLKGLKVAEARKKAVEILDEKDLLKKIDEKYVHRVGTCYRCHSIIEPLPLPQFFIKTKPLAQKALQALDSGETVVLGAGREKILRDWLENIRDWNISRQVVWGIKIPVWYRITDSKKGVDYSNHIIVVFRNSEGKILHGPLNQYLDPRTLKYKDWVVQSNIKENKIGSQQKYSLQEIKNGLQQIRVYYLNNLTEDRFVVSENEPNDGDDYIQETDAFDTWFSSGQWPVVTLKTGKVNDFETFYPTSVMETGYDILPFWVMRMMLLGIYMTGKSPFKYVYLHGLIRDEKGRKMSKSVGNVINPLELVEKYGADAIRFALVMSSTPGNDSNVGENKIKGMRNLANKIWNAGRFIKMLKDGELVHEISNTAQKDTAFDYKLKEIIETTNEHLDKLRIGLAAEYVYGEFWHWFCDECIESGKKGELSIDKLEKGMETFLKLLHPFAPFVTEAVWQSWGKDGLLINESWN